jgi:hypothetical protein
MNIYEVMTINYPCYQAKIVSTDIEYRPLAYSISSWKILLNIRQVTPFSFTGNFMPKF